MSAMACPIRFPGSLEPVDTQAMVRRPNPIISFAQGLARQGYVALIYDPIGQGERLQYPDENLKSKVGVGVREHLYAGNQQFLVESSSGHGEPGTVSVHSTTSSLAKKSILTT